LAANIQLKLANTWGAIPLGRSHLQVRSVVFWLSVVVWILWTCIRTGPQALIALAYNTAFVIPMMIISRATTTVPIATICTIILCGGLIMGIAGTAGSEISKVLGAENPLVPFFQATFEEILKILPVLIMLWRGRKFTSLTLGATDVLLLGVASGAGFAFVEDAFMHAAAWQTQVLWLPSAEVINGRMIAGHAIWTGLAAGTIGLALMRRHHKKSLLILAPFGITWAIVDHVINNYASSRTDLSANVLNWITGNGYITIVLFVSCYVAAILLDRFVLFKTLPKIPEFRIPSSKDAADSLQNFWEFVLDRRRLAYAYYRYSHRVGNDKRDPALVVAILMQHLINCHASQASEPNQGKKVSNLSEPEPKLLSAAQSEETPALDLPDRYLVLSVVSQGGMGVIYKARHAMTGAKLAVKTLHPHLAKEQINVLRFEQEARAASALKHPNLVVVHDFGLTPSKIPFLVMDLIEGTNLQEEISGYGPLSVIRFCNIFIQSSDALAHAHKRGVIHRDIKPSNMILAASDDGQDFIRIVDFGIAKVIASDVLTTQELTQTGDLVGSPLYMSPEQCMGTALDARSDIYSLGCVMYEAITGKAPFLGANSVQTIFKHIHEMPQQPQSMRPDIFIPPALEQVIFRTLQKDPAARYANMDELRVDLEYVRQLVIEESSELHSEYR
jgi:RsiW-degrading membrane proteinase PrsW (M82 family)/tRNA A-37 threonylcarbamoyl transferase component Bud32